MSKSYLLIIKGQSNLNSKVFIMAEEKVNGHNKKGKFIFYTHINI